MVDRPEHVVEIPYIQFDLFSDDLVYELKMQPRVVIDIGNKILRQKSDDQTARIRIIELPEERILGIREIRNCHLYQFVSVEGLVKRVSKTKFSIVTSTWKCARCPAEITIPVDDERKKPPLECLKEQNGCARTASSTRFTLLREKSSYRDVQYIEIQENPDRMNGGMQPEKVEVHLWDTLCGTVLPGDRVIVNGWVELKEPKNEDDVVYDLKLIAHSIEVKSIDLREIKISEDDVALIKAVAACPEVFERLIHSISPSIYGYEIIKEGIVLQMFGGTRKTLDEGTRLRGDIHILLFGDPGVAKSQILHYMANMAPRSIYASGKSSSGAGLTAAAVKDDFDNGSWTLEAGAMVIASGGMACLDELDKMRDSDRSSLHEGMESQEIHVAKAGIIATLRSDCCVLAAANPSSGRFNPDEPIVDQTNIEPPLLSRFDLIFAMLDKPDRINDRKVAEHILDNHWRGQALMDADAEVLAATEAAKPFYEPDFVRKYVTFAKRFVPKLTAESKSMILKEYCTIRDLSLERKAVTITPRQLDAYVRLSEASARVRLSPVVEECDVKRAARIVNYYLEQLSKGDIDAIMSVPKTRRDTAQTMKNILMGVAGKTMTRTELIKKAIDQGAKPELVNAAIDMLLESGQIIEPEMHHLKLKTE